MTSTISKTYVDPLYIPLGKIKGGTKDLTMKDYVEYSNSNIFVKWRKRSKFEEDHKGHVNSEKFRELMHKLSWDEINGLYDSTKQNWDLKNPEGKERSRFAKKAKKLVLSEIRLRETLAREELGFLDPKKRNEAYMKESGLGKKIDHDAIILNLRSEFDSFIKQKAREGITSEDIEYTHHIGKAILCKQKNPKKAIANEKDTFVDYLAMRLVKHDLANDVIKDLEELGTCDLNEFKQTAPKMDNLQTKVAAEFKEKMQSQSLMEIFSTYRKRFQEFVKSFYEGDTRTLMNEYPELKKLKMKDGKSPSDQVDIFKSSARTLTTSKGIQALEKRKQFNSEDPFEETYKNLFAEYLAKLPTG